MNGANIDCSGLFCKCNPGVAHCQSQHLTLLVNEFDVQRVLHGQLSVAAVNHIYVFNEVMKCCKNRKIH